MSRAAQDCCSARSFFVDLPQESFDAFGELRLSRTREFLNNRVKFQTKILGRNSLSSGTKQHLLINEVEDLACNDISPTQYILQVLMPVRDSLKDVAAIMELIAFGDL